MFAAFVWIDRLLKNLVSGHMRIGDAIPSPDAFFSIRYTINEGVSFSMLSGNPNVLIVLQSVLFIIVALVWVAIYREVSKRHFPAKNCSMLLIGLTWIVSGGAGNLIDRVLYRYVIDFISVGTFPIWNFADMCIVGGCILVGVHVLFLSGRPDASVVGADQENSAYLDGACPDAAGSEDGHENETVLENVTSEEAPETKNGCG
jgi:signal peptidase II